MLSALRDGELILAKYGFFGKGSLAEVQGMFFRF
jgi:hypothetical protein